MIKFFRKIRQNLLMENKTAKYFKYAIGEIILVVVGILIALQINNWNESRKATLKEIAVSKQLLEDAKQDSIFFEKRNESLDKMARNMAFSLSNGQTDFPELNEMVKDGGILIHSGVNFTSIIGGNINEFLNVITNPEIKESLRDYMTNYNNLKFAIELLNSTTNNEHILFKKQFASEVLKFSESRKKEDLLNFYFTNEFKSLSLIIQDHIENVLVHLGVFKETNQKLISDLHTYLEQKTQ
ncbi:DUF6090 family protein [Formosa maritima]|uniref:Uncharacterized protein n=1 Tax=Formosa maritima TaxID=2592046 RepID=A0A5D0G5H8_9FLAO|nr:DUF6090 family protein [Formosa maritima]TYA54313.1 hypothetical protein FVF61_08835 [Formosa maritima]